MIQTLLKIKVKNPAYKYFRKFPLVFQYQMNKEKRVLLPTNITPLVYKLTLEPDLEKCTYTGHQEVTFKLNEPTKR